MDILLFGMQGSGKGTQARILTEHHNFAHFETGAELRKLAQENSALGGKVKSIIEAGHLVPNEVVMEIVENFIGKIPASKPIVFDGIPRKLEQAESLEKNLSKHNRDWIGVFVEISEEEALKRLGARRICPSCKSIYPASYIEKNCRNCNIPLETRSDDTKEAIKTRIQAYKNETLPVIEKYTRANKIISLNGAQSIEAVNQEFFQKVAPKLKL